MYKWETIVARPRPFPFLGVFFPVSLFLFDIETVDFCGECKWRMSIVKWVSVAGYFWHFIAVDLSIYIEDKLIKTIK